MSSPANAIHPNGAQEYANQRLDRRPTHSAVSMSAVITAVETRDVMVLTQMATEAKLTSHTRGSSRSLVAKALPGAREIASAGSVATVAINV